MFLILCNLAIAEEVHAVAHYVMVTKCRFPLTPLYAILARGRPGTAHSGPSRPFVAHPSDVAQNEQVNARLRAVLDYAQGRAQALLTLDGARPIVVPVRGVQAAADISAAVATTEETTYSQRLATLLLPPREEANLPTLPPDSEPHAFMQVCTANSICRMSSTPGAKYQLTILDCTCVLLVTGSLA